MPPGSMRSSLRKAAHEAVEGEHVKGIRGIARRIEQIRGDILAVNQGTLYPLLLKPENEGSIASQWGASENNRRARLLSRDHDRPQTAANGDPRLEADRGYYRALL